MSELSGRELKIWKSISDFVSSLDETIVEEKLLLPCSQPARSYALIVNKTKLKHTEVIKKHINLFTSFCKDNIEAIEKKNVEMIKGRIEYSERCILDILQFLKMSSSSEIIWSHLLTISALINPKGKAKQILKDTSEKDDFLESMMTKVSNAVGDDLENADPMALLMQMMAKGTITEIMGDIQHRMDNGTLDMDKLSNTLTGLMEGGMKTTTVEKIEEVVDDEVKCIKDS